MDFLREKGVAFTGHRSYRSECDQALMLHLRALCERGFRDFYSGMAEGFDLAAAEAVVALRREFPIRLIAVLPHPGQAHGFSAKNRLLHARLLEEADRVVKVAQAYHAGCFHRRNDFLVEQASHLVAYYNGSKGGTHYTLHRAQREGLSIKNLHNDPQPLLFDPDKEDNPLK